MPQPKPATAPSPHDATAEENWLALRFQETPEGRWFRCRPESEVATELRTTVARGLAAMDYFAVETWVAGRTVIPITPPVRQATSGGGGHAANPLAMANRTDNGTEWLKVSVFLSQPALLYADQRSRRFWFGSLIAISAVAALTGLWANWRALQNQQRLSELKSTFVSSVSHELRTPVASVRLLVDSLENGTVSGPWKQRQYLRLISQECRRLSALIENILDFSRIEQGRKQFDFEPTDVLALAEQTVRIIEPYAAERRVALSLLVPSAPARDAFPLPLLDGRAIEQALLNLIDNAIKHSPEGQTVRVGVVLNGEEAASAPGGGTGRVVLWVEDCGGGIPLEEQEKIFERFYRRGSELRRETQGVGIGLSIVKHIVEAHGGRVAVRSAIGQGSRFAIELPMNHPQEDCSHAS
jgi:signal transduction histidine kinase